MAQDGYGLSRGVSGFFDVYFKTKQQRQQQAEAVQKAQLEQRQQNFYEMMQRSQLLQRQQEAGMERNLGIEKNISSLMGDYVPAPEGYTGQAMSGKQIESLYPTSLGGRDVFPDKQQYIRREDLPKQKTETPHFKTDERGVVHEWDEATGEFKPTNLKERLPSTDSLIAERRQQLIDEANEKRERQKQERLDKYFSEADSLIATAQGGLKTVGDKQKMEGYTSIEGDKAQFIPKREWKARAKNTVNRLTNELGLNEAVSQLIVGSKRKAKQKGVDFDSIAPQKQRDFLKSVLDNSDIPETEKRALYQYIEVYTR